MSNSEENQQVTNPWIYKGEVEFEIPEKAIGFIYRISHADGKFYYGRKLLTKAATKTVNGKKKKIRKASDWQDYWSSSPALKEWIEKDGLSKFSREILMFVTTKAALVYAEEYTLFSTGALFDEKCINGNIRSRIQRTWFNKTPDLQRELEATLALLH